MEIFLFCWALAWLIQRAVVDTTHAVRGTVSPRMQVKMEQARTVNPAATYGAGAYFGDLWADTWADATASRRRRKAEKAAAIEVPQPADQPGTPRPSRVRGTATTEPWTAPVMPTPAPSSVPVDTTAGPETPKAETSGSPDVPTSATSPGQPGHKQPAPTVEQPTDFRPDPCMWNSPGGLTDGGIQCRAYAVRGHVYCWPHIQSAQAMFAEPSAAPAPAEPWTADVMQTPEPPDLPPLYDRTGNEWRFTGNGTITGHNGETGQQITDTLSLSDAEHQHGPLSMFRPSGPTAPGDENPAAATASQGTPDYLSTYTDEERRYWSAFPAAQRPYYFRRGEEAQAAANTAEPVSPVSSPASSAVPETSASTGFPGPLATVTPITKNTNREDSTMTSTDPAASGETVSLASARAYAASMAAAAGAGHASVEQSMAHLTNGDVKGEALAKLAAAQEALSSARTAFEEADAELAKQEAVKDAYQAVPDAGDKKFVTGE